MDDLGLRITNSLSYVFPSAEKLYDNQRELILKIFPGIQIMDHYEFSENAASASKCRHGHYHEDFEIGHMELVDKVSTSDGYTSKIVATGFKNLGMPFVRMKSETRSHFS